ncbi:MAG: hypothetical protein AMJ46_01225 [Latescibacteria bacterium DG_63]|nr:MAG: hypothetical protein AMJ46_01225 [Latescibacteria bacterium DG_63]
MERLTGIVGVPPSATIRKVIERGDTIIDLDATVSRVNVEAESRLITRYYCAILRTVLSNALKLPLEEIYIDVGEGKCDGARHIKEILKRELSIPVIATRNSDSDRRGNPICLSSLPLVEKFEKIVESVELPDGIKEDFPPSSPVCGFWGVPPRDFELLELFPDSTHVFGWTRCMENKTPSDGQLELEFDPSVPTVFYAQSFCAKNSIAYYLAHIHPRGFYIDGDFSISESTKAKVEAFLELNGIER